METMERTSTSKESTIRQILDLAAFVASVLARLSFEQIEYLLKNKNIVLRKKLQEVFEIPAETYEYARAEWQRFYKDNFKMDVDFAEVSVPDKPSGDSWILTFIPAGLTLNVTLAVMRSKFKVWTYCEDLDANVPTNTRTSAKSYAIWVRDGVEPDEKYLGKSTRDADMEGKIGVTLLERFVFGLQFFVVRGEHLDHKGVTLCTGSRGSGGSVPRVYFDSDAGRVRVGWYDVDVSHSAGGLRQAVS